MAFHDVVEDIFKANQHSIEVRQSLPKSMFSMGNAPVFQTPSSAKHQAFPKFRSGNQKEWVYKDTFGG